MRKKFEESRAELLLANKKLAHQNDEKEKRAAELVIANKELAYQNDEKEKRAEELIIANKELAYQDNEKEKRAAELIIANKELAFQNKEKEERANELVIANRELLFQNLEKEKLATELNVAYNEIKKAEEFLKQYIQGLEDMIFMTHHRVRKPITNILGLANVLDHYIRSPATLKKMTGYMKTSALDLDVFTRELTTYIVELEEKGKTNNTN